MPQTSDYALLAADAYRDARQRDDNYAPIPPGWVELIEYERKGSGESAVSGGNGFSARVYRNGSEIVIAYAGTQFGGSAAGQVGDWTDGNGPLALGLYASQAKDAALLYQQASVASGSGLAFCLSNKTRLTSRT